VLQKKEEAKRKEEEEEAAKRKEEEEEAKAEAEAKAKAKEEEAKKTAVPLKQLGKKGTAEEQAVRLHSRFCLALLSLMVSWFSHGFHGILMVFM